MPRPPKQPQRADVEPEERIYWDRSVRRRTGEPVPDVYDLGAYFGGLLSSPPLCAIASELAIFARNAGNRPYTYTDARRDYMHQLQAADLKPSVVMGGHVPD